MFLSKLQSNRYYCAIFSKIGFISFIKQQYCYQSYFGVRKAILVFIIGKKSKEKFFFLYNKNKKRMM